MLCFLSLDLPVSGRVLMSVAPDSCKPAFAGCRCISPASGHSSKHTTLETCSSLHKHTVNLVKGTLTQLVSPGGVIRQAADCM